MPPPQPDPPQESTIVTLLRHLEWQSDGFSLVFLFADVGPAQRLLESLHALPSLAARKVRPLSLPEDFVTEPERAVDRLMEICTSTEGEAGAIWCALQQHPSAGDWNRARKLFLARLNERRFLLERDMKCPLVLVLPPDFKAEARDIAPDIWHVRALSAELRADAPVTTGRGHTVLALPRVTATGIVHAPSLHTSPSPTLSESKASAYDDWRRIVAQGLTAQAYLPTAWRAIQELADTLRLDQADEVARTAESLARSRLEVAQPATLRELSITLDHAGQVAYLRGEFPRARALYEESLSISRGLADRSPESWDAARDLSIALDQVGKIAMDSGAWDRAEQAFTESLEITRRLWAEHAQESNALHELTLAIDQLGDLFWRLGKFEKASELYRESLGLSRLLVERGDQPEAPRDLSIALEHLGRVEAARGNLSEAETVFRECLERRRQLNQGAPDSDLAADDLVFALQQYGHVVAAQGDVARAEEVFEEAKAILRSLLTAHPGNESYQRRLDELPERVRPPRS